MSFSSGVRDELAHLPLDRPCCALAELAAMTQWSGMLRINSGGASLRFHFENSAVARRAFNLVKQIYQARAELSVVERRRLKAAHIYRLTIDPIDARMVLTGAGLIREDERGFRLMGEISPRLLRRTCCRRAYLRGAFLSAGSMTDPKKDYHIEFVAQNPDSGKQLLGLLEKSGFAARMIPRKQLTVVYIKGGEAVSDFLGMTGAHSALLQMESIRVMKGMRNQVNRVVNCDNANLEKTINSSTRQVASIETIIRFKGLDFLNPALRRVAEVRLNNPDATLAELASMMDGEVQKSGINHRLKRIEEIANALQGEAET